MCLCLYKIKEVYNKHNKVFLCSYLIYLTDSPVRCTTDPLLYSSADIYILFSSKSGFLSYLLLQKSKTRTK